jgi:enoyl-CoA hydratase
MAVVETTIDGRVATVTVNRPEVMNAFDEETLHLLRDTFLDLARREEVGAVVLTGAGKAFVAGADISEMRDKDPLDGRRFAELGQEVTCSIEAAPQPVIAAVNGYALGGGCEVALACDIRLASERARFGQPEVNLGIIPGWGGTQRLSRLCGPGFARELIFTGRMCSAEEAYRWGLVNAVYPPDELPAKARELAESIASKSRIVLQQAKLAALRAFDQDLAGGLRLEADLFGLCFATQDQKEGMTAFLEKRAPQFTHR